MILLQIFRLNNCQTPSDEDLEIIPKIKRCQITLTKFLGSGAFGEVYEGQVQDLHSEDGESTKIAVKTLRKGRNCHNVGLQNDTNV